MFYDLRLEGRLNLRGSVITLVALSPLALVPLLSATRGGYSDAELAAGALDAYEGSAWLSLYSIVSCSLGLFVTLLLTYKSSPSFASRMLLLNGLVLLLLTITGLVRHHYLMQQITRVNGTSFGAFP